MNNWYRKLFVLVFVLASFGVKAQITVVNQYAIPPEITNPPEYSCTYEQMTEEASRVYFNSLGVSLQTSCTEGGGAIHIICHQAPQNSNNPYYYEVYRWWEVFDDCGNRKEIRPGSHQGHGGSGFEYAQYVRVERMDLPMNDSIVPKTFHEFSLEDVVKNNSQDILAYLRNSQNCTIIVKDVNGNVVSTIYGVDPPSCWGSDVEASYTANLAPQQPDDECQESWDVTFWLRRPSCPWDLKLSYKQRITLAPTQGVSVNKYTLDDFTISGCGENRLPAPITSVEGFKQYGVELDDYLKSELFEIEMETQDHDDGASTCSKDVYHRIYHVTYPCPTSWDRYFTHQLTVEKRVKIDGVVESESYELSKGKPNAHTTINAFLNDPHMRKAQITSSCPKSDLVITHRDSVNEYDPNQFFRYYIVYDPECEDILRDSVLQFIYGTTSEVEPFKLKSTMDATVEDTHDGEAELEPATYVEYCPACSDDPDPNKIFQVEWHNKTTGEVFSSDPDDPECEVFHIDTLTAGKYTVKVFPICPDFPWERKPIYTKDFEIGAKKLDVYISPSLGLYAGATSYRAYMAVVTMEGKDGEYVEFEEFDKFTSDIDDEWKLKTGLIYSPKVKQWQLSDMYNSHMEGLGMYESILWQYELVNGEYSHNLQRMIVAKNERREVNYKMKRNGKVYREAKPLRVYTQDLKCSNDPNEINGPVGYTSPDSTMVRMINADDVMGYTIQFENDPEFATAAAARVMVYCPLDPNADPTTFRLGNFGFGSHTFEVPPTANYFHHRYNIDTLGYWLDVTANIQGAQNQAYWIFQTIDPATGSAPIDSLGFLPVNDSLGSGEGYVTFNIAPKSGNVIHTGDSIVEHASIYFDENDVVPTNRYKNIFDAEAPISAIVCDTTGVTATQSLTFGFDSSDDEGGSGVAYVELYADVDMAGFEQIAQVHPDSVFVYTLSDGSVFGFMGLAVDNVGNKEPFKTSPELSVVLGTPPFGLELSNEIFEENDTIGTAIGTFTTLDDQNTDLFVYTLVSGEGSDDNDMFSVDGSVLKTNYDFRCYGNYSYNIRVRTTDLTNAFLEKSFTLYANRTEEAEVVDDHRYLCPSEYFSIGDQLVSEAGTYYDTLSNYLGCDSVVRYIVHINPDPETTSYVDELCYGDVYDSYGFDITADSMAQLTQGWDMQSDLDMVIDRYVENAFGCDDTVRVALSVHPSYHFEDEVSVCASDLPYTYHYRPFFSDTTAVINFTTDRGCDSVYILHLTVNPIGTQSEDLVQGWNWYSTYIDQSNGEGLEKLEQALGTNGVIIKSKNAFVNYSPELGMWYGNLNALNNTSMFMINMSNAQEASVIGCPAEVDTIMLENGWNWIGYPMMDTTYVDQLSQCVGNGPTHNDLIKSKSSFAIYDASFNMWFGSLQVLEPGIGYMYRSENTSETPLYYPNRSRKDVHLLDIASTHWVPESRKFAENMTMLGVLNLDYQIIESDTLEIGAFSNGEERGSGRAVYIEELDAYRIFLTIHGEEGDDIIFRLYDHNREHERRIRCDKQVVFHPNESYGTLTKPYLFNFMTDYDVLFQAEICEGEYYEEHNFKVNTQGMYFNMLTTATGNDSIIRLDLTVNPVYHVEEEVVAPEFPYVYENLTFETAGTYTIPFQTENACDSVLVIKVVPYEGLRELLVSPVPAKREQRVSLYYPFTNKEQNGLEVKVYTLTGQLLQAFKPTSYPIELDPFASTGTYVLRITMGTGEVLTGKIVIK